jgi:hypothetical protein
MRRDVISAPTPLGRSSVCGTAWLSAPCRSKRGEAATRVRVVLGAPKLLVGRQAGDVFALMRGWGAGTGARESLDDSVLGRIARADG